jgi:hypothetical protein
MIAARLGMHDDTVRDVLLHTRKLARSRPHRKNQVLVAAIVRQLGVI